MDIKALQINLTFSIPKVATLERLQIFPGGDGPAVQQEGLEHPSDHAKQLISFSIKPFEHEPRTVDSALGMTKLLVNQTKRFHRGAELVKVAAANSEEDFAAAIRRDLRSSPDLPQELHHAIESTLLDYASISGKGTDAPAFTASMPWGPLMLMPGITQLEATALSLAAYLDWLNRLSSKASG